MKLTKRPIALAAIVCAVLLAVSLFILPLFFPWSELNCSHQEVDINTGRLRYTEYRFFRRVSERIVASSLSRALPLETVSGTVPNWHKVNTFSPGTRHSPHYIFHSAIHQITTLEHIWDEVAQSRPTNLEEFKRATAHHVLALWKHGGSDTLADEYISRLSDLSFSEDARTSLASVTKLTMPIDQAEGDRITTTVFFPDGQPLERIRGYRTGSGEIIQDGLWERWSPGGTRLVYGHLVDGQHDGPRYEWDRKGILSSISIYTKGVLTEYHYRNLRDHPEFKTAQQVSGDNDGQHR